MQLENKQFAKCRQLQLMPVVSYNNWEENDQRRSAARVHAWAPKMWFCPIHIVVFTVHQAHGELNSQAANKSLSSEHWTCCTSAAVRRCKHLYNINVQNFSKKTCLLKDESTTLLKFRAVNE